MGTSTCIRAAAVSIPRRSPMCWPGLARIRRPSPPRPRRAAPAPSSNSPATGPRRRPPWRRHPLDRWIEVDSLEAAALLVGRIGRRAWLTVGANSIAAFTPATGVRFVVRLIDPPREPLPLRFYEVVTGRGPFSLAEERHLLERHAVDVLVCKASGGAATEAKLIAARELSLPVIMVRRPPAERGPSVEAVEAALDWLDELDRAPQAKRMS